MKLYNDEIYIIAPTEIKTVFDLEGKRIEAPKDVGLYSAKAIFSRLKINVTYDFHPLKRRHWRLAGGHRRKSRRVDRRHRKGHADCT